MTECSYEKQFGKKPKSCRYYPAECIECPDSQECPYFNGEIRVCAKFDECMKIDMILDKDIMPWQYAEAIESVCANCEDRRT